MIKDFFKDIQIGVFFLGIICFFPLFRIHYNSYAIILFALVCVWSSLKKVEGRRKVKWRIKHHHKLLLKTTLIFYVFVLSLSYTKNLAEGLSSLQHLSALFVIPIIIFLFMERITKKELNFILWLFVFVCVIHAFYLHYNFLALGLYNKTLEAKFYDLPFRDAVMNLKYESQHPTYVSLWYTLSIAILLNALPAKFKGFKSILSGILIILAVAVFVGTMVLLSSRIGVISLILVLGLFIYMRSKRMVRWTLFIVLFFALLLSFKNISYLSSRFITEFRVTTLAPPEGQMHNSINIRIGIYQCALDIIKKNPIIGLGIGDVQDELNKCYTRYNTDAYVTITNSHNYFLNVLLVAGIVGLIVFLYMFYIFFKFGILDRNFIYICFLLSMCIGMLFENVLSRNHGVIFFAVLNTVFVQFLNVRNEYAYRSNSVI